MENYKETVEKINETFTKGDTEGFLSYCADDVTWNMVGEKTVTGIGSIREFMAQMEGFEPPIFTVDSVAADGEYVAAQGDMTMKDENGNINDYRYCDFYRFSDGKIIELNSYVIKQNKGEK